MTCNQALEGVIDGLVADLSPEERRALDEHLASCEKCTALARQYRQMWSELPAATVLRSPTHGWIALQAKMANEQKGGDGGQTARRARTVNWTTLLKRAAVVVLLVGLGVIAGMRIGDNGDLRSSTNRSTEATADTTLQQFVLLFYEVPGDAELRARASDEINAWARAQFRGGVVVTGSEMPSTVAWAGSAPGAVAGNARITHYIRIRAADLEDARRIASSAPATSYGGFIEVRPVGR